MIKKTFPRLLMSAIALCFCLNMTTVTAITQEMKDEQGFVSIGPRGVVCRIDRERNIVEKLWPDGRLMFEIGVEGRPQKGEEPLPFVDPVAVAQDEWSRIYVLDKGSGELYRFNYLGELEGLEGEGILDNPVKLHDVDGKSVIGDGNGRYVEKEYSGKYVPQTSGWIANKKEDSGTVYLLKSGDVSFVRKWGSKGGGDEKFNVPEGIDVAPDGSVYVADSRNDRVKQFTASGEFIRKWGGGAAAAMGDLKTRQE